MNVIVFDDHPELYQVTLGTYEHHDVGIVATLIDNAFPQKVFSGRVSTNAVFRCTVLRYLTFCGDGSRAAAEAWKKKKEKHCN